MPRRNVWYDDATDRDLIAFCRERGIGRGEATRVLMQIAAGNHAKMRHALREHLSVITAGIAVMRQTRCNKDDTDSLDLMARAAMAAVAGIGVNQTVVLFNRVSQSID